LALPPHEKAVESSPEREKKDADEKKEVAPAENYEENYANEEEPPELE
jgi:hypothetical protein